MLQKKKPPETHDVPLHCRLATKGIDLRFLRPLISPLWPHSFVSTTSYAILEMLLGTDAYDVVHFSDNNGLGYWPMLAKKQGWAFEKTAFLAGLHGPDVSWASLLNKRYPSSLYALELDYYERKTVELSDFAISPSAYMLRYLHTKGWVLPEQSYVIFNALSSNLTPATAFQQRSNVALSTSRIPVAEIVFYGRLEQRKGFGVFVDTIHSMLTSAPESLRSLRNLTFMGRMGLSAVEKQHFSDLQQAWATFNNATFDVQVITDAGREEALEYIGGPGRLVVMPSLNDNLPYTIMECLVKRVQFIATAVGGIPELIHPHDRTGVLFQPSVRALSAKLRERLSTSLSEMTAIANTSQQSIEFARPSFTIHNIRNEWLNLHRHIKAAASPARPASKATPLVSVAIVHYERLDLLEQAIEGVLGQDYPALELIVLDDGSSSPHIISGLREIESRLLRPHGHVLHRVTNRYIGDARNAAAQWMKGRYLLSISLLLIYCKPR